MRKHVLLQCMLLACLHAGRAWSAPESAHLAAHRHGAAADPAAQAAAARLAELLEVYSLRHARCMEDPGPGCAYVLVTTNTVRGGLGNRLPSLVTGLLLALATRRTLMLDFELWDDFFAHPLDFGWQAHAGRLAAAGQNLTFAVFEEQPPGANAYAAADFGAPPLAGASVLHILQDRDYNGALLAGNPHHAAFVAEHFSGGGAFHPLARWLLRLAPPMAAAARAHARRHFTRHTVGIQIRLLKGGEGIYAAWAPPPGARPPRTARVVPVYCVQARFLRDGVYGAALARMPPVTRACWVCAMHDTPTVTRLTP